jgi:hypothetical protein
VYCESSVWQVDALLRFAVSNLNQLMSPRYDNNKVVFLPPDLRIKPLRSHVENPWVVFLCFIATPPHWKV